MKFLTYVALVGTIAATRLMHKAPHSLIKLRDDDLESELKHGAVAMCEEAGLSPEDCMQAVEKDEALAKEAMKEAGLVQMRVHARTKKALVMIKNRLKDDWPELTED